MDIQKKIKNDLKSAMINKDIVKRNILRVVIGEFNRIDKEVSDDKALSIIKKMIINANENKNYNEIEILNIYLPKQFTELELKTIITSIIDENNFINMGLVMKTLKDKYNGQYDGKLASNIVKKLLS